MNELPAGELALHSSPHAGQPARPIPQAHRVELAHQISAHLEAHALTGQPSLEAIDVAGAVALERHQFAVQVTRVLRLDAGDVHHAPHFLLAAIARQHYHHASRAHVQPVCLGALGAAIDFNAGRVHDPVLDALREQEVMQPESVAARLVATQHARDGRHAKAFLGQSHLLFKCDQVARGDRPFARLLSQTNREPQPPLLLA